MEWRNSAQKFSHSSQKKFHSIFHANIHNKYALFSSIKLFLIAYTKAFDNFWAVAFRMEAHGRYSRKDSRASCRLLISRISLATPQIIPSGSKKIDLNHCVPNFWSLGGRVDARPPLPKDYPFFHFYKNFVKKLKICKILLFAKIL